MKKLYQSVFALVLLLPLSMASLAEPPMPPSMEIMGSMTEEQKDQHARAIQEHQLQMHDLSNKILAEQDPAKKEQLKNQQLSLMKAHHARMMAGHHRM